MKTFANGGFIVMFCLSLVGCGPGDSGETRPVPREIPPDAISHFGHMIVLRHHGPKAQLFLKGAEHPIWFSNVRDLFSYTLSPDENQNIRAMYVHDMGRAATWETPGPGIWIDAKEARYVMGSRKRGGMGGAELIPFREESAAHTFVADHGGSVVSFDTVPASYVFHGAVAHTVTQDRHGQ